MKPGIHGVQLITHGSTTVGINLGFDAATEHEMGIKHLRQWLAMGDHAQTKGVMRKRPNLHAKLPKEWQRVDAGPGKRLPTCDLERIASRTVLVEFDETPSMPAETRLLFYTHPSDRVWRHRKEAMEQRKDDPWLPFRPRSPKEDGGPDLGTMWSDRGFTIRAFGDRERAVVREIHDALLVGNLAVGLSGPTLFGQGLSLMIADRIPQEDGDAVLEKDLDLVRLHEAAKKTGIEKKVRNAGLKFFALSPRWVKDCRTTNTTHEVAFWLNPQEQHKYKAGLFTVEDLADWTKGKGRVLSNAKGAA